MTVHPGAGFSAAAALSIGAGWIAGDDDHGNQRADQEDCDAHPDDHCSDDFAHLRSLVFLAKPLVESASGHTAPPQGCRDPRRNTLGQGVSHHLLEAHCLRLQLLELRDDQVDTFLESFRVNVQV
ncbi:hypothetical protein [Cryobacterium sp. M25]|uniref:hypothetical protein n=1 Tax=Cryobacterium sp. M25 TaxID=2048293 RepID=UPI001304ABD4|nr:hypothetical protein [Cryobacterium sp. M25]